MGRIVILIFVIDSVVKLAKHLKDKKEKEVSAFETKTRTQVLKERHQQREHREKQERKQKQIQNGEDPNPPRPFHDFLAAISILISSMSRTYGVGEPLSENDIEKLFGIGEDSFENVVSLEEQKALQSSRHSTEEYRKSYDFVRSKDAATEDMKKSSFSKKTTRETNKKEVLFQENKKELANQQPMNQNSLGTQKKKLGVSSVKKDSSESAIRLQKSDLKRAILWKEILEKPVSLRH